MPKAIEHLSHASNFHRWQAPLPGPCFYRDRTTPSRVKPSAAILHTRTLQERVLSLEEFQAITLAKDEMKSILCGKLSEKNSMDFINTRNFIDRLVYEIRNPAT